MDLVLRAIVVFVLILVITRAVGRRELSSMEPFDLILLVVMGDLIQQGVTQSDNSLTGATIVIATIPVLTVGTATLPSPAPPAGPASPSYPFRRLRPLLEGDPIVLVAEGRVIESNLRRQRMTIEEVLAEARQQSIGGLGEIEYAVLETNGRVSFLKR